MKIFGLEINRSIKTSKIQSIITSVPNIPFWTENYTQLAEEGYKQNDTVYACINYIAKSCAGINWLLYDGEQEILIHPILKMFKRPNPQEGWSYFFQKVVSYLFIAGNVYIEKAGNFNEIYCLRPDRVQIEAGDSIQPIKRYVYSIGGQKIYFKPEEILHLKLFNPLNDWYGLSPIQVAGMSIDQNTLAKKWNSSLLKNSGRPSAIITPKEGNIGEKGILQIQETFKEETGYEHAGIIRVLDNSLNYQQIGLTPMDMDWANILKSSNKQIAIDFHIPPELIGDSENKTYSNYQEARKSFYTETILPLMDYFKDEFNNWIFTNDNKLHLEYNSDEIEALQEDRQLLWQRGKDGVNSGIITPNEAREFLGYTTVKGANDLLMPSNLLPYTSVPEMSEGLESETNGTEKEG